MGCSRLGGYKALKLASMGRLLQTNTLLKITICITNQVTRLDWIINMKAIVGNRISFRYRNKFDTTDVLDTGIYLRHRMF